MRQLNPAIGSPEIVRTLNEQNAAAKGGTTTADTPAPVSPKPSKKGPRASPKKKTSKPQTLDQKILYQVQYYFSDKNLSKDKFLREQMAMDPRGEDWVMVGLIATFGKVKTLCKGNSETVIRCLRDSQWLMLSEDEKYVRRRQRYAFSKKVVKRTAYATGLPSNSTVSSVELLLGAYGKVEEVVFENKGGDKTRASVRFSDPGPVKRASKAFAKDKSQPVRIKPLIVHLKHLKEKSEKVSSRGRAVSADGGESVSLIAEDEAKPKRRPRKRDEFNWRLELRPEQANGGATRDQAKTARKRADSDSRRQRNVERAKKADLAAKHDPRFSKARTSSFRKRLQLKRRGSSAEDGTPAPIRVRYRMAKGPAGTGFNWTATATGWGAIPATHVRVESVEDSTPTSVTSGSSDAPNSCANAVPSPVSASTEVEVQA
jgi:hypothetical protein